MDQMWKDTSAFLEVFLELTQNYYVTNKIVMEMWCITYRFREEDGTAWVSCGQADPGSDTRLSTSSKRQNGNGYIVVSQVKVSKNGGPDQKTISNIFAASIFKVWNHQWPYPDNVRHHID